MIILLILLLVTNFHVQIVDFDNLLDHHALLKSSAIHEVSEGFVLSHIRICPIFTFRQPTKH